ncbi:hypothetical protein AMATHDRAFT_3994 [Amanita thiersii Skay4041]|uniref:DUF4470 domain-containing protein n=1 Tax=Amanita thiersii Skay4041 TaxID=703135 RepID=A0A2A9NIL5_9AGAR|nr:hypothetical protein AMATHDRAFT_3994 [Amanita thiersii Skay4041]
MSRPTIWCEKHGFQAMGDSPAVCLTDGQPPEQSADILLLGCGDVRNVLYTIYADLGTFEATKKFDFTCCDIEPAVLARNIILYSLIFDRHMTDTEVVSKLWSIYYHFFIDRGTLEMVKDQSRVLVRVSENLNTWKQSRYGGFLRFCSAHTLSEIRRHWTLYGDIIESELHSLKEEFNNRYRKGYVRSSISAIRSAGPLWFDIMEKGQEQLHHYWKTGVTFTDPEKVEFATFTNPTFAYSLAGRGFSLHFLSHPFYSFHLANALAPVKEIRRERSLHDSCFSEFQAWCSSLNTRLNQKGSSVTIRFFVGDALAFCRALHYAALKHATRTCLYTKPWSLETIKLDGGDYTAKSARRAPFQFDVIDTADLSESLGLLTVLITATPLLRKRPSSILHTNTFLPLNEQGVAQSGLAECLRGDIPAMSMILDLTPVQYISNFKTYSNAHEMMFIYTLCSPGRVEEHITWRIGSLSDPAGDQGGKGLRFSENELAGLLYSIYLNMFSDEERLAAIRSESLLMYFKDLKLTLNTRFTFAYLLWLIKDRVHTNWDSVMQRLEELLCDEPPVMTDIQELLCHLHVLGVYSSSRLSGNNLLAIDGPLNGWSNPPPLVCIVLVVPRSKFDVLERFPELENVVFMCTLTNESTVSAFHDIHCFFGSITVDDNAGSTPGSNEPSVSVKEDTTPGASKFPVICTFYVPSRLLCVESSVALAVRRTPNTAGRLRSVLPPSLILFSANVMNKRHVHVVRERPGNPGELKELSGISFTAPSAAPSIPKVVQVRLDTTCSQVNMLTGRADFVEGEARVTPMNWAAVEVKQVSLWEVQVSRGPHEQVVSFPFPVTCSTRIITPSKDVEVDVPVSNPLNNQIGMALNRFPIINQDGTPSLWNIHYLNLDRLPVIDSPSPDLDEPFMPHIDFMFSDRERQKTDSEGPGTNVMTRIKQSIFVLFIWALGLQDGITGRTFALVNPEGVGLHTIIFVNDVCLDLASHTIVLDACILPITRDLLSDLGSPIRLMKGRRSLILIPTDAEETKAWKYLFPAFTERCRKWAHKKNCEYIRTGVPVSEEMSETPLCGCGAGKNLGPFMKAREWEVFRPYVTRAAICPLFPVPFVDTVGGKFKEIARRLRALGAILEDDDDNSE